MSDGKQPHLQNMAGLANQEKHFCDAVIIVAGIEFHVHKVILCRCISYFRDFFGRHSDPDQKLFEMPGLSAEMMELIVEFAYEGIVSVTEDNIKQLIQVADQFNMTGLLQTCCDSLVEKLRIKNCIGIWQLTKSVLCAELQQKTFQFVIKHFEEVVSSEEFQQLSAEELADILGRDELNVSQESTVLEAILKWVDHTPEERTRHFAALFPKVRLALTSAEHISSVSSSALVRSNDECMRIVELAAELKDDLRVSRPSGSLSLDPIARPRIPNTSLLAIGGWDHAGLTHVLEAYNIRSDRWIELTDERQDPHIFHGTAFCNGSVYCVGGYDEFSCYNIMCRLDLKTLTWHEAAPMHDNRAHVAVTVHNGYIYAIGGIDGSNQLNSAERYTVESNQWSFIASMYERRCNASCTALHNKIYICGGFNGISYLSSCEHYTPETNQWTRFASMSIPRWRFGAVAYADQIFALGGGDYNSSHPIGNVEAYNPQTNKWRAVASMLMPRKDFGIGVIENKLFAVGGYHNVTMTGMVEYYESNTDKWSAASCLGVGRSGLSCCVVSDRIDIAEQIGTVGSEEEEEEEEEETSFC